MRAATALWCGALWTAGCFTGQFLAGQPCTGDGECGPTLRCEQGVCGGTRASSGETSDTGSPTSTGAASTASDDSGATADASTGGCDQAVCQQVDLLLIVDDSPSMAQWDERLEAALAQLGDGAAGELLRASCDLHVGVLPTGTPYTKNPEPCQGLGALVRVGAHECNQGAPFATQVDELGPALDCLGAVGSQGSSDERPVQALLRAITPQNNAAGACNDGFFRRDSLLVILLITDEDDDADADDEPLGGQSPGTPEQWFTSLVAFKGSPERIVMLALTGDRGAASLCPWQPGGSDGTGAEAPERLAAFVELFPRNAIDTLCQRDYAGFIAGPVHTLLESGCAAQPRGAVVF